MDFFYHMLLFSFLFNISPSVTYANTFLYCNPYFLFEVFYPYFLKTFSKSWFHVWWRIFKPFFFQSLSLSLNREYVFGLRAIIYLLFHLLIELFHFKSLLKAFLLHNLEHYAFFHIIVHTIKKHQYSIILVWIMKLSVSM